MVVEITVTAGARVCLYPCSCVFFTERSHDMTFIMRLPGLAMRIAHLLRIHAVSNDARVSHVVRQMRHPRRHEIQNHRIGRYPLPVQLCHLRMRKTLSAEPRRMSRCLHSCSRLMPGPHPDP